LKHGARNGAVNDLFAFNVREDTMLRTFILALSISLTASSLMASPTKPLIHVFAAQERAAGATDCTPWEGKCLVFANKGQPIVLSDYTYEVAKTGAPAILLNLSQTDAGAINTLIQTHHASRLALVIDGALTAAPKVKAQPLGTAIQLSFENRNARHEVESKLQGR
jgi:hypothetical protein